MNIANVAAVAGVEALFVTQDTGQVEKAYGPNDARSIFGYCITKRVFNLNDIETAEWAARHLGENTVYSQQISEGKSVHEGRDFFYSEQSQKLMSCWWLGIGIRFALSRTCLSRANGIGCCMMKTL